MKKTVRITCTKEYDIEIPDHLLTDEELQGFDDFIGFSGYSDNREDKVVEMFTFTARQIFNEIGFAEGIGEITRADLKRFNPNAVIEYSEVAYGEDWEYDVYASE